MSASVKCLALVLVLLLLLGCVSCRPAPKKAEKSLEKQLKNLQKMKCKPRYQKFLASELIPSHNGLKDKDLLTNVVPLKRCDESCSYCGNRKGREVRKCLPAEGGKRQKMVFVRYLEDGEQKTDFFWAEEHKKCECQ